MSGTAQPAQAGSAGTGYAGATGQMRGARAREPGPIPPTPQPRSRLGATVPADGGSRPRLGRPHAKQAAGQRPRFLGFVSLTGSAAVNWKAASTQRAEPSVLAIHPSGTTV